MKQIMIVGFGNMGQRIAQAIEESSDMEIAYIVKENNQPDMEKLPDRIDAVIDFSHPNHLTWLFDFIKEKRCAYVCGTTGHSEQQKQRIEELSHFVPVVFQANFSLGVAVMKEVLAMITPMLEDEFDMEIVEKHHNQKQDAPSGTAKMLLEVMNPNKQYKEVYGREGFVGKRQKEIGVHALRGGSVAGEHSAYYFGDDEILEIKHTANSRKIFVNGALHAVRFAMKQTTPKAYTMKDILFTKGA